MYKIKISCTHKEQLNYNNSKINEKNSNLIFELKQLINNYDYIDNVYILNKKKEKKNTLKTLEFSCNNVISNNDFELLIKNMHIIGFKSNKNTINFYKIDIDNKNKHIIIYSYYFTDIKEKYIKPPISSYKNKYIYYTQIIHKK